VHPEVEEDVGRRIVWHGREFARQHVLILLFQLDRKMNYAYHVESKYNTHLQVSVFFAFGSVRMLGCYSYCWFGWFAVRVDQGGGLSQI
jgi:hypothetical protein